MYYKGNFFTRPGESGNWKSMMRAKLAKNVKLNQHKLARELEKLNDIEKAQIKMLETDRKRFRIKHKKLELMRASADLQAISDTYEPTISKRDVSTKEIEKSDLYKSVYSMLFTDDEVDLDKVLCLHLLTAHAAGFDEDELASIKSASINTNTEESEKLLRGAWCEILPCYIVESQRDESNCNEDEEALSQHQEQDSKVMNSLEHCYRQYARNNKDFDRVLHQVGMPAPCGLGKVPIFLPELYSDLLADKEATDELSYAADSFLDTTLGFHVRTSHSELLHLRSAPIIFHSQDNAENLATSDGSIIHEVKYDATKKLPLNPISSESSNQQPVETSDCTFAYTSAVENKLKNCIYFHSSFVDIKMHSEKHKSVYIYINSQLKLLVEAVLDVLKTVNPEKIKILLELLQDPIRISIMLKEEKIKLFLQSLRNSSLISSQQNFILITALAIEGIDTELKNNFKQQVIAETFEIISTLGFDDLLGEIRKSILQKIEIEDADDIKNSFKEIKVPSVKSEDSDNSSHESSKMKNSSVGFLKMKNSKKYLSKISSTNNDQPISIRDKSNIVKNHLEPRKISQETCYTDPDRVILRRMTHVQRILVGQMCANLKTKQINNEGISNQKVPLAALIAPVLSEESIRLLTQGTVYAKDYEVIQSQSQKLKTSEHIVNEKLTASMISKIRYDIAENETKRKLENFMKNIF